LILHKTSWSWTWSWRKSLIDISASKSCSTHNLAKPAHLFLHND